MKIKFFEDHSGLLDRDLKKVAATMSDVSNMDRMLAKETGVADFDPTLIGKCFQRGFRSDHVSLSGDTCLLIDSQHEKKRSRGETSYIDFSERETPMDFLLALGFSIDEASNALKDDDVRNRLLAAIIEVSQRSRSIRLDKEGAESSRPKYGSTR